MKSARTRVANREGNEKGGRASDNICSGSARLTEYAPRGTASSGVLYPGREGKGEEFPGLPVRLLRASQRQPAGLARVNGLCRLGEARVRKSEGKEGSTGSDWETPFSFFRAKQALRLGGAYGK